MALFIEQLKISLFDPYSAVVEVEKNVGKINSDYTAGGRIDIVLSDKEKQQVLIENKIYAKDQENQLVRYQNHNSRAHLFYLTLFGENPSGYSSGPMNENHYRLISYKTDIIEWLNSCREKSVELPVVRETITQYINLVKHLTNQTENNMKAEVRQIIINHPDLIDSIDLYSVELNAMVDEADKIFKNLLKRAFLQIQY